MNTTYVIIGDVHEQVNSLRELITRVGFSIQDDRVQERPGFKIVLVGDYLDKDVKPIETIDFIHRNIDKITMLIGNHERWIYRWFFDTKNNINRSEDYIEKYFTSLKFLEKDTISLNKFKEIFECSIPFFEVDHFIVTHAPVKKKYLGNSDSKSIKNQINLRRNWDDPGAAARFLLEEADDNDKLHIFGHIAVQQVVQYKNKICIDTGAFAGNMLSALIVHPDKRVDIVQVETVGGEFFDKSFQELF